MTYFSFIAGHRLALHLSDRKILNVGDTNRTLGSRLILITMGFSLVFNFGITLLNQTDYLFAPGENISHRVLLLLHLIFRRFVLNLSTAPSQLQMILFVYVAFIYKAQLDSFTFCANLVGMNSFDRVKI